MASSLGRLVILLAGFAAAHSVSSPAVAQSRTPDVAPVYLMGLSEVENGLTAVRCELDVLPVGELRKPDVINRIAREKFGVPVNVDFQMKNEDVFVLPRVGSANKSGGASAAFDITYNGFSSEAQTAFQYAADIWGMLIQSSVPIKIEANWLPLGFGVLGSAGPEVIFAEFGAGEDSTWYVPALADALSGEDQDAERNDIVANFSSSFGSWYFGLDGQTPPGMVDFVTVVLHEIGHGLGFMGSMDVSCTESGQGCWGFDGYPGMPIIYDRFAEDASGNALIDESAYANPSTELGDALEGGGVYFAGPAATAGHGGSRPPLFAPSLWEQGSSYSHLDELTFSGGNGNALMTPYLSASSALHDPGPVGCGVFADIGWSIGGDCGQGAVIPTSPTVPVLLSPRDGASDQPTSISLDWRDADRATAYDLEVSTSASFASPQIRIYDLTETAYLLTDLTPETTYYWHVRSTNASEESAFSPTYSFTTATAPPAITIAVLPEDGAVGVPTNTSLKWMEVTEADTYELQVAIVEDFSTLVLNLEEISASEYAVTNLERDTRYFWRVRAVNEGGPGEWSKMRSFTTIISAPTAPSLVSPMQDEVHVATTTRLNWSPADRAQEYDLQVATDDAFSRRIVDAQRIDTTAYEVAGLKNDTRYFWRVRAENSGGKGDWSEAYAFRTVVAVPAVPALLSPDNDVDGAPTELALSWSEAVRAESYEVQVARTSTFDPLEFDTTAAQVTAITISRLAYQETYYWRVRALNVGGASGWSTIRSFKTQVSPPSSRPSLASPFNGAGGLGLSTKLSWNVVVFANEYDLQVSADSLFSGAAIVDTTLSVTSATIEVPDYEMRYFWRVRAVNAGGGGPWSDPFAFSTRMAPPGLAPTHLMPMDAAPDQEQEVEVAWQSIDGISEFDLQVAHDSSFQRLLLTRNRLQTTSFALHGLAHDSTYYWRLRARNDGGLGGWSDPWHFTIKSVPSGVAVDPIATIPGAFALHQNYPNPFNPQTRIRFEIARAEQVTMSIFDASGRLVDVLLERAMQPGTHEVEWNAAGHPSGVYLCRLEAGDFLGHIPLILMK